MFIFFSGHLGLNSSKHLNERNWHTLPSLKNKRYIHTYLSKRSIVLSTSYRKKNLHLTLNLLIYESLSELVGHKLRTVPCRTL